MEQGNTVSTRTLYQDEVNLPLLQLVLSFLQVTCSVSSLLLLIVGKVLPYLEFNLLPRGNSKGRRDVLNLAQPRLKNVGGGQLQRRTDVPRGGDRRRSRLRARYNASRKRRYDLNQRLWWAGSVLRQSTASFRRRGETK